MILASRRIRSFVLALITFVMLSAAVLPSSAAAQEANSADLGIDRSPVVTTEVLVTRVDTWGTQVTFLEKVNNRNVRRYFTFPKYVYLAFYEHKSDVGYSYAPRAARRGDLGIVRNYSREDSKGRYGNSSTYDTVDIYQSYKPTQNEKLLSKIILATEQEMIRRNLVLVLNHDYVSQYFDFRYQQVEPLVRAPWSDMFYRTGYYFTAYQPGTNVVEYMVTTRAGDVISWMESVPLHVRFREPNDYCDYTKSLSHPLVPSKASVTIPVQLQKRCNLSQAK